MSKLVLKFPTQNNNYQEIYNILKYNSKNTKMKNFTVTKITEEGFFFSGIRVTKIPFIDKIKYYYPEIPEEIDIDFRGYVDNKGNFEMNYYTPSKYSDYLQGKEKTFKKYNEDYVNVELNYTLVRSNEAGMFGAMKNMAYNKLVDTIEPQFEELYKNRKGYLFNKKNDVVISDYKSLLENI